MRLRLKRAQARWFGDIGLAAPGTAAAGDGKTDDTGALIAALDYVRQTIFLTHRRRGKPAGWRIGRLVGYAELRGDAPNDGAGYVFARRVFYLMAGDRDGEPDGTYRNSAPMEAVERAAEAEVELEEALVGVGVAGGVGEDLLVGGGGGLEGATLSAGCDANNGNTTIWVSIKAPH